MEIENLWDFLLTTSIIVGCVLLVLWGLLLLAGSFRRKKSAREKKPEPAKKTVISDHHPKTGGGHDHDDHHGHGGGGLLKWGLGILLLGLFCWFVALPWLKGLGFGQVPGASAEVRYAMAPQGTIPGRDARASEFVCPVLPSTWQRVIAPSNEFGLRSETLDVPICHRIRFCDRKRDPHCMATSFAGSRFNLRCATPTSRAEHEFVPGRDRHSTACSVQSNSNEDIKLVFRYEFDPSR